MAKHITHLVLPTDESSAKSDAYVKWGQMQRKLHCELEGLRKMLQLNEQMQVAKTTSEAALRPRSTKRFEALDGEFMVLPLQDNHQAQKLVQDMGGIARCEEKLQAAERGAAALQDTLHTESVGLAHLRESMDLKWRDVARRQDGEIRELKKSAAEKDAMLATLRHELRQALHVTLVHEEELVTRSNATLRRNEELSRLLAAAHDTNQLLMAQVHALRAALDDRRECARAQAERDEQLRLALEDKVQALQVHVQDVTRTKEEMHAVVLSMLAKQEPVARTVAACGVIQTGAAPTAPMRPPVASSSSLVWK
ncbi:Aste57867_22665 [Aphanomyces stellatus]|uniref:Aste57867_22665 protein n=1 Tax=Aphanomyces stellatus TaxID=120398 RepID=A0A485LLV5_9STRA|nr:hypothetical protein As57867_022595 [Aphanomyces stellatus]VFT99319.1 Aste57867_22665 [Aphanomyces stellatus]